MKQRVNALTNHSCNQCLYTLYLCMMIHLRDLASFFFLAPGKLIIALGLGCNGKDRLCDSLCATVRTLGEATLPCVVQDSHQQQGRWTVGYVVLKG